VGAVLRGRRNEAGRFGEKQKIAGRAFLLGLAFATWTAPIHAEDFPTRPITLIMPWGAGTDVTIRALASAAEKYLGQSIVVENRPGAGGALAPEQMAATAKPDGYTISQLGPPIFRAPFIRKTTYDPTTDFTYIIAITALTTGVAVRSDAPWKTFREFLADARAHPGMMNYGSAGTGSNPQVALERVASQLGIKWVHIPYKSSTELVQALLSRQLDAMTDAAGWAPQVDSGQFRLLVTGGPERSKNWPDVPTMREAGFDIVANAPNGIGGPKGMDPRVVKILHDAFKKALDDPAFVATIKEFAQEIHYMGSAEYHDYAVKQFEEERVIAEELGAKLD
jgi:tripartite-type tricarboxylate transporter receptor subunit TctC